MPLILRLVKGSALTYTELDGNFTYLSQSLFGGSFTGSLQGTSSWANSSLTSSFVTSSNVRGPFGFNSILSSSYSLTASYALNAGAGGITFPYVGTATISGSLIVTGSSVFTGSVTSLNGFTGSLQGTASYVTSSNVFGPFGSNSVLSSSFSSTASFINTLRQNVILSGSLTVVTGSGIEFQVTDAGVKLGNIITDAHTITGSLNVSGSITSSLFGTSSWAFSASQAITASYITSSNVDGPFGRNSILSSSYTLTASLATTASSVTQLNQNVIINGNLTATGSSITFQNLPILTQPNVVSYDTASGRLYYIPTASLGVGGGGGGSATPGGTAGQLQYNLGGISFAGVPIATYDGSILNLTASLQGTSSWAQNARTASFVTSSNVWGPFGSNSVLSSSYAITASFALNAQGGGITFPYIGTATISGSLIVTGSSVFTGSVTSLNGFTGSLQGTASWAASSSIALTASFVTASNVFGPFGSNSILSASFSTSSSFSISSSLATSASFSLNSSVAISSSFAGTASLTNITNTTAGTTYYPTFVVSGSGPFPQLVNSGSFFYNATSNTLNVTSSLATSASFSISSSLATSASQAVTASYILNSVSSSFAGTASLTNITNTTAGTTYYPTFVVSGSGPFPQLVNSGSFSYNATSNTLNVTASLATSASFSSTSSFINTLRQNLILSGGLTVVTGSGTEFQVIDTGIKIGNLITDVHTITGSINVSGSITSSLFGTSSWAISASQAVTASYVLNAISSSFAATASSADNLIIRGAVTSSNSFITGSTRFGSLQSNTHEFTGSARITGSLNVVGAGITGSLFGTSSWANNVITASFALTASNVLGGLPNYISLWSGSTILSSSIIYQSGSNVGINTISPHPLHRLDISGSLRVTGSLVVGNITSSGIIGRIDASNDVVAFSTSDQRLKENIIQIKNPINKVQNITGVYFDWREELKSIHGYEGKDIGVIAQEIKNTLPEAVRTNDTGYLSVRYEKIIPLLIEAIKDQQKQIDELKTKLNGSTS